VTEAIPAVEGRSHAERPGAKGCLFVLGLGALALLLVATLGLLGYRWFLMPTTSHGTCFVLDGYHCTELSGSRIETTADITIPSTATIVDSGSSRSLKTGSESALIRLTTGDALVLGATYGDPQQDVGVQTYVSAYLARRGIGPVDAVATSATLGATVYLARDGDGTSWAYVRVVWDG
jgi:hypothetical protein